MHLKAMDEPVNDCNTKNDRASCSKGAKTRYSGVGVEVYQVRHTPNPPTGPGARVRNHLIPSHTRYAKAMASVWSPGTMTIGIMGPAWASARQVAFLGGI